MGLGDGMGMGLGDGNGMGIRIEWDGVNGDRQAKKCSHFESPFLSKL
jgi:hypothetical protein